MWGLKKGLNPVATVIGLLTFATASSTTLAIAGIWYVPTAGNGFIKIIPTTVMGELGKLSNPWYGDVTLDVPIPALAVAYCCNSFIIWSAVARLSS